MEGSKYVESGMIVDLSAFPHFRFEDCKAHQRLHHIKEIDFGWWNKNEKCLYLLELKSLNKVKAEYRLNKAHQFIDNLWKKSIDVLTILTAVWLENNGANEIKNCLPQQIHQKCNMRFYHLINCNIAFEPHLPFVNDTLKQRFRGYCRLFETILDFRIISSRQAENKLFINPTNKKPFVRKHN